MILGITGSIGTGKTTVSRMFEKKGAYRIDLDRLSHEAIEKEKVPYRSVVHFFGKGILRKNRTIDRLKLAHIVFKDPRKLNALNRLIHPYVIRRMEQEIRRIMRQKRKRCIVVEVPLLHETDLTDVFDRVIAVACRPSIQRERWVRQGRHLEALKEREAFLRSQSFKKEHSDFVIDNSGTRQKTQAQANRIWKAVDPEKRKGRT